MRINLIYLTNLNYRKSLFDELGRISQFNLLAGSKSPYKNIVNNEKNSTKYKHYFIRNLFFLKGHHRVTFQVFGWNVLSFIRKSKKSHFIFLGIDPHIISSLIYVPILVLAGYKVSWWGHGTIGNGFVGQIRKYIYSKSHRIFVYGNYSEVSQIPKLRNQVKVIGNCMNWEDYSSSFLSKKERVLKTKKKINLIFSGRINSNKRIQVLLKACLELDIPYELRIIGNGVELEKFKYFSKENDLKVIFLGEMYGDDVKDQYAWADLMIIPGKVGLSIVHGYGNCLPVLMHSSYKNHSPEYEIHTMNKSFLFDMDSHIDLKDKITNIWLNDLLQEETKRCAERVYEFGYLPNIVASKIKNSL